MTRTATIAGVVLMGIGLMGYGSVQAQEDQPVYAVVSELPKDKTRVSAKIAIDGTVLDIKLLASEAIVGSLKSVTRCDLKASAPARAFE